MSTELLKQCPLFAGLKEEDLKEIRGIALLKQVGKKKVLFSDVEEAKGFYVILSDKVKLYKISPEGKEQILPVVSPPAALVSAMSGIGNKVPTQKDFCKNQTLSTFCYCRDSEVPIFVGDRQSPIFT